MQEYGVIYDAVALTQGEDMKSWFLIIDVERCSNCCNCVLANKDEYVGNDFPGYSAPQPPHGVETIRISRVVRGDGHLADVAYLPTLCNHCDDAPCIKQAGDEAIKKRADGLVIIDPVKARGRRDLIKACPYGAIEWNAELQIPQAWTFDAHLLDQGWKEPRCAQVCPTEAIVALKTETAEVEKLVKEQSLEVLQPELATKPRVYYKNLHRVTKHFIGGSVLVRKNGVTECLSGASASLLRSGATVLTTLTGTFGDFKFDGINDQVGCVEIRVSFPGYKSFECSIDVTTSVNLGDIVLTG